MAEVIDPRRTRDGVLQLIVKADGASSKKAEREILGNQSIHNVSVCDVGADWNLSNLTVSRILF